MRRLLLLPGLDGLAAPFETQLRELARAWRPLVLEYGDPHDPETYAGYVDRAGRALAGESAVVLGMSFGGTVALSLALSHPECVEALVLLNSFARLRGLERGLCSLAPALRWLPGSLVHRLRMLGVRRRLFGGQTPDSSIATFLRASRHVPVASLSRRLGLLRRWDARQRLAGLQVPILLLASDRDLLVPSLREARLMAGVTGGRVCVIQNASHMPLYDPDVSLAALLDEGLQGPASNDAK